MTENRAPRMIHLVANSHIDPMYMWRWDEGVSEGLSTFRAAVELCEQHAEFVFNHNEAFLYEWVRQVDPPLFERIRRLVAAGQWHIMGGWYVQPDCNLPSGESLVRQILTGLGYFRRHFGVRPVVAINFDSFGHTRGLVQILRKCGFEGYLFCRPGPEAPCPLPADDFLWTGFDGSEILGHRSTEHYNSAFGEAAAKLKAWLAREQSEGPALMLWGVGNHGGGPSRKDVLDLRRLAAERPERLLHSTPDAYFSDLSARRECLPRFAADLVPVAEGSYTTLSRVKQRHRQLENELFATEKMRAAAAVQGLLPYPAEAITEALHDLLLSEFHDALAGSMIAEAEQDTLQTIDHGLEILARLKYAAFVALTAGQARVRESESALLAYNPHPYPVTGCFEVECGLPPNRQSLADLDRQGGGTGSGFTVPVLRCDGREVPCQLEKEHCHKPWDWRKRIVFSATLPPSTMSRFDCSYRFVPARPVPGLAPIDGRLTIRTPLLTVVINCRTGLLDALESGGRSWLRDGACRPVLMRDRHDAYGWAAGSFGDEAGEFRLMTPTEVAAFTGFENGVTEPVRVIEQGAVRTVVEALLQHGESVVCMRYAVPAQGTEVAVELRVNWNEKARLLKWVLPTRLPGGRFQAQSAYGSQELAADGREHCVHAWAGVFDADAGAVTCINDGVHGCDSRDGEMRFSLLRATLYLGSDFHPTCPPPRDRAYPRIDRGEHVFRFWLNAGPARPRRDAIDREALAHNETPYVLSLCPSGEGRLPQPLAVLEDDVLQLSACKQAEDGDGYILRFFEPTGTHRRSRLRLPALGMEQELALAPFEVQTWKLDAGKRTLRAVTLAEDELQA